MKRALISLALFFAFVAIVTVSRYHSTTTTTSTTTSTSTTTTVVSSTTTTSVASANGSTCAGSDFSGSAGLSQGAAGTIYTSFTLTKTTPGSCTLKGWPLLGLENRAGVTLPERTVEVPSTGNPGSFLTPAANQPPTTLTLQQNSKTSFSVAFSDVTTGTETSCPTAAVVLVGTGVGTSTTSISSTYPIQPCNHGTLVASPFY